MRLRYICPFLHSSVFPQKKRPRALVGSHERVVRLVDTQMPD